MESAAASILKRAVEMDSNKQYTMALVLYQEGIQILLDSKKETTDPAKQKYFAIKASEYLDRAEKIKILIEKEKATGTYRELIKIETDSIGHGYGTVFGRFLDATVTYINIEDPYIRAFHQCQNFVRLCELAVRKCHALSKISLVTTLDPDDKKNQIARLNELKQSLSSHLISFEFKFSDTLHDRQIILSNGWIIKIGRGLDYFKAPNGKFVLGACDLELRPCSETTIDIFHKSQLKDLQLCMMEDNLHLQQQLLVLQSLDPHRVFCFDEFYVGMVHPIPKAGKKRHLLWHVEIVVLIYHFLNVKLCCKKIK